MKRGQWTLSESFASPAIFYKVFEASKYSEFPDNIVIFCPYGRNMVSHMVLISKFERFAPDSPYLMHVCQPSGLHLKLICRTCGARIYQPYVCHIHTRWYINLHSILNLYGIPYGIDP